MPYSSRAALLALSLAALLPLTACQTTSEQTARQDRTNKINSVLEQAASESSSRGDTRESLAILESLYQKNSADDKIVVKYAAALRDAGRMNRAAVVLSPFIEGRVPTENGDVYLEYASIMAATGDYPAAEAQARQAATMMPENGRAYHILGIALDAQGHSQQAEIAFRKALEFWEGDPVPVMNNLGLNLASQGFIDEAIDTLRKAAALAPNRTEVERNLRIVTALQVQPPKEGMRLVPMPPRKPERPGA